MNPPPEPPLLAPPLLAAAEHLVLTARRLVAAAVAGLHPGRQPGRAREFNQYRAYQPGDEPRHIDWKLFARSDRFFLREGEFDARLDLSLILDATESMQHRDGSDPASRKFDRARSLAAALALVAENQGDRLALHVVADGEVSSTSTVGRRQPFRLLVHRLTTLEPRGRWPEDPRRLAHALRRTEIESGSATTGATNRLLVVLTDGHEHHGEIRAGLAALNRRHQELVLLRFQARDERDFPYQGPVRLEEWETGDTLEIDATAVRERYLREELASRRAWAGFSARDRFDYLTVMSDEPLEHTLRTFLRRRMRP